MDLNNPPTLQEGDTGQPVAFLQKQLNKQGASLDADGVFGPATEAAAMAFQRRAGLVVDGIVGAKTWAALQGWDCSRLLKERDLIKAAEILGVELAAIKAVNEVESRGTGFLSNGKPDLLFERHVMYRRLQAVNPQRADKLATQHPNLVNPKPGGYAGGAAEYQRLARARLIDNDIALESASWGLYQIMGFHWEHLGYDSVQAYADAMHKSEREHLKAFVGFIRANPKLHQTLRGKKWGQFARIYNGPNYKRNLYDVKLARAYQRHLGAAEAAA